MIRIHQFDTRLELYLFEVCQVGARGFSLCCLAPGYAYGKLPKRRHPAGLPKSHSSQKLFASEKMLKASESTEKKKKNTSQPKSEPQSVVADGQP